jgi:hypothetical protein
MSLKKYFKSCGLNKKLSKNYFLNCKGQSTVEYFILFCVFAALSIFVTSSFLGGARAQIQGFASSACSRIISP